MSWAELSGAIKRLKYGMAEARPSLVSAVEVGRQRKDRFGPLPFITEITVRSRDTHLRVVPNVAHVFHRKRHFKKLRLSQDLDVDGCAQYLRG